MAKRQVFKKRIFLGLAILVFGCLFISTSQAALLDINTTIEKTAAWDGFAPDFEPDWQGKTTKVTTWSSQPTGGGFIYTGGSGTMSGTWDSSCVTILGGNWLASLRSYSVVDGYWETHSTVQKVDSCSHSSVTNSTFLQIGGQDFTATKNASNRSEMARYAELVSSSGELLANASSIAYKTFEFNEDDFSASGRVSSFAALSSATLSNNKVKKAEAKAIGRSWFDATYELEQNTNFSLELDIARLGDVAVSFSAIDTLTNEQVFSLPLLEPNSSQTINIDGTLSAGTYEFLLDCETTAALDSSGGYNLGGEAEFDFSFDLEEEYYDVWVPGYLLLRNGTKIYDYEELYNDILSGEATIPSSVTWENANFNGEGGIIGSDVTILAGNWQYGVQADGVSSVPEPSTIVLLVLGGLSYLLATGRRNERARQ